MTADDYERAIAAIHRYIAQGDTYQVSFTLRLSSNLDADPWDLFESLCRGQRSRCSAFVDTGQWAVCSASPELFFRLEEDHVWSRPMKGTSPRGRTQGEDEQRARWLQTSAKNRAENVMIVDMVRNDLGRIATPDSVRVRELWNLEKYPSLFQMTSTVEARTQAPLAEIFAALFPCASVTGAPKVRAMEIIRELEPEPRGVYTGAIGLIGPGRRARFNVGIRTVAVNKDTGGAEYGTGGGIVWDSVAQDEWQECRTKSLVLQPPPPDFQLLETMLWTPEQAILLRSRHLQRLSQSAKYFDRPCDLGVVKETLKWATSSLPPQPHRLRLLLDETGKVRVESTELDPLARRWRVAIAAEPVASGDPFLFHKTTHREVYEHHRKQFPDHDDVLLWNENGEITESTTANVVVLQGQELATPRLECGLLAGTLRSELLASGKIVTKTVTFEDLTAADEIYLINSVRQWIDVDLDLATLPART